MSSFRPLHFRKNIYKLEQVQQKATQMVRRLKHLLCREAEAAGLVQSAREKALGRPKILALVMIKLLWKSRQILS